MCTGTLLYRSESCDFHWASLFTPLASLSPGSGVEGMTPFHGVQFFYLASFAMASSYPFIKPLHRLSPCRFVGLTIWTVSSSVSFLSYQNNQPIFLQEHIDFLTPQLSLVIFRVHPHDSVFFTPWLCFLIPLPLPAPMYCLYWQLHPSSFHYKGTNGFLAGNGVRNVCLHLSAFKAAFVRDDHGLHFCDTHSFSSQLSSL